VTWCSRCLYPDTKPDLQFVDGVCSACLNYDKRKEIDWGGREIDFREILNRSRPESGYDCIIPVSGGKDSHAQVIKVKELGFNPLLVTASTDSLTPLGRRNIENLKRMADYIEVTPRKDVRWTLNKLCLTTVGDISWPEHVTIFTIPARVSVGFQIPLIIWGECPQNEYGGPAAESSRLDRGWLEEYGGLLGLRVSDLPFTSRDLIQYSYPTEEELERTQTTGVFMGYYFPWDGAQNADIAEEHGFERYDCRVEASGYNYENLDNYQTGIHDFFKFIKLGFGRATDITSSRIRRGLMSRSDGIAHAVKWEQKFPISYLGRHLADTLEEIGVEVERFTEICEEFKNYEIFGDQDVAILEHPLASQANHSNSAS
jgi:N-acetyl sugar amidotransferase